MNVLITRAAEQIDETAKIFIEQKLSLYVLPMIKYELSNNPVFRYDNYDYCMFSSPTAVEFFAKLNTDMKINKYAAVGKKTADKVTALMGVGDVLTPESASMDEMLKLFEGECICGKRILAPGAKERIQDVSNFFAMAGADLDLVTVYKTSFVKYGKGSIADFIDDNNIDVITFFSPSAVKSYFLQATISNDMRVVAIGKTTAQILAEYGVTPICPAEQTTESMASMLKSLE